MFVDDAFIEFSDDEPDDPAFGRSDGPWEEEGCPEFASIVCTREPRHCVRVEGEKGEGDKFEGRGWS